MPALDELGRQFISMVDDPEGHVQTRIRRGAITAKNSPRAATPMRDAKEPSRRWTIPPEGEPGEPIPDWLLAAFKHAVVLKAADGVAMVPAALSASCMAKRGDTLVLLATGAIDIEHADGAAGGGIVSAYYESHACIHGANSEFRSALTRSWGKAGGPGTTCTFIGLNPSTADGQEDDPTIRRCVGFARRWRYVRLLMVNLFDFRATSPADMRAAPVPCSDRNDAEIVHAVLASGVVVCAWGNGGAFLERDREVLALLAEHDIATWCLGINKSGQPKHPLYLRGDSEMQCFPPAARS